MTQASGILTHRLIAGTTLVGVLASLYVGLDVLNGDASVFETLGIQASAEPISHDVLRAEFIADDYGEDAVDDIMRFIERHNIVVTEKDSSFVRTIDSYLDRDLYPVVDKTLSKVFYMDAGHQYFMELLHQLHEHERYLNDYDFYPSAEDYIVEHGYFISSMSLRVHPDELIILHPDYEPDRLDHRILKHLGYRFSLPTSRMM